MPILEPPKGTTCEQLLQNSMIWARYQNNQINVNFHFKKSLEIFDKSLADKNLMQKGQWDKNIPRRAKDS
jgi:hypothetical protein